MRLLGYPRAWDRERGAPTRARLGVALGLLFLAGALGDLLDEELSAAHKAVLLLGVAVFVVLYMSLLPPSRWLERLGPEASLVALGLLPVIAVALLVGGAPSSFAALFVYFAAAVGMRMPPWPAAAVIGATAVGIGIAGWASGENAGGVAATVL